MDLETVLSPFREDHRQVLSRIRTLDRSVLGTRRGALGAQGEARISELLAHLARQFATHMRDEEQALYPALLEAFPAASASLGPLEVEHRELRSMLARLTTLMQQPATAGRDEQLGVQVRDFVDLLRIHIRKEEAAVFGVAARVLKPEEVRALAARLARPSERPAKLAPRDGLKGSS